MPKIVIAAVALAALVVLFALAWRKLFSVPASKGASKKRAKRGRGAERAEAGADGPSSAADLIPLERIEDGMAICAGGAVVSAVKVESVNTSLFTKDELVAEAERNAAVLATIKQPFSVIQVHRSPDNTAQRARWNRALADVESRLAYAVKSNDDSFDARKEREYLAFRRATIRQYMADDERVTTNASASETDSFICLRTDPKARRDTMEAARSATASLLRHLSDHGFTARRLGDEGMTWLLKSYFDEPPAAGASMDPLMQIPVPDFVVSRPRAHAEEEEIGGETW